MKKLILKLLVFFRKHSRVAVDVTNLLKQIVESKLVDLAVNIIPGNVDNEIAERLRKILPKIAIEMAVAHKIISDSDKPGDVAAAIVAHLKELHPDGRIGFWVTFAGKVNEGLSDGKISLPEAIAYSQLIYDEFYKK